MELHLPEAYELVQQELIEDIHSQGYLLRHKKSGARVMILKNEDENKVFHIAFRTPPADSTGVAHILEHSVLCGSKRYPSKDPFVELVKGSLNTFLNAMTYPDKTMYPVASCNEQDFCNLMSVYMDAVFFTNIYEKEEIFRQEGWGYQLESAEDDLTYNGVVYNEMKGAFSSADDVLNREILNSLFPDTPYANESGGDPAFIPDLKYSEFLSFHSRYYHPSNSYIYLYGDMDFEERLVWLDQEYLRLYDAMEIDSAIPKQKPFDSPKEIQKKYSISNTDSVEENSYLSFNAVVGDSLDVQLANAFAVIEYTLLSAPGAPMKQALLDAKVGKDIMGSYDSGIYQPIFSVVAKYADAKDKEQFLSIIREILENSVKNGLNKKSLLAGINHMEFKFREADFGQYPKGLIYAMDVMDSWLYDDHAPFDYLKQLKVFAKLKELVDTDYFESLIQTYLLNNTHTSIVIVEPQKGLTAKVEEEIRKKLSAYKESLSVEAIEELVEKTRKLRQFQETPSAKEELELIPMLEASQIERGAAKLYNEERFAGDTKILHHNLETNGIAYLNLLFDTAAVPVDLIPYLGILRSVLGMVDTKHYTYGELFNEIQIHSGGIYAAVDVFASAQENQPYLGMFQMKAKVLFEKLDFAFDMIKEILFTSNLRDEKRLHEIMAQMKSRLSTKLDASGHTTAAVRAMSYFSETSYFNELINGISFYKLVESIEENFEEKKEVLMDNLEKIMKILFQKENLLVSVTADEAVYPDVEKRVKEFAQRLPQGNETFKPQTLILQKKNEGFLTSSQIQYVCRAGNFKREGYEYTGALKILRMILSYEYLWNNIRVKGGAYGCMSGFGRNGDSYFVSYRDPNLKKTLEVYDGVVDYVKNFQVDDRDMTKYIIGTISDMDTPLTPAGKGGRSLTAYLNGLTMENIQKEREQILDATQEDIRNLWERMEAILKSDYLCVIGNEEKLEEEKDLFMALKPLIG